LKKMKHIRSFTKACMHGFFLPNYRPRPT
jgi:hypothetical protein